MIILGGTMQKIVIKTKEDFEKLRNLKGKESSVRMNEKPGIFLPIQKMLELEQILTIK